MKTSMIYINTYSHNRKLGIGTTMCYMINIFDHHQVIDIQRSIKYYGGEPFKFFGK